jgi:hypothetical protein
MVRHAIHALTFLALLVLVDRAVGALLGAGHERVDSGDRGGLIRRALGREDAELVVFGSSRARRHYEPAVLGEKLGLRAYNAGCDGQGVAYARMLERLMLGKGMRPRALVLQADTADLYESLLARAMLFAPYYGRDPVVDALLESATPFGRLKLQSWSYRYNSMAHAILRNLLAPKPEPEDGFLPAHGTLRAAEPRQEGRGGRGPAPARAILPGKLALFEDFASDAARAGSLAVLVAGPELGAAGPERGQALAAFAGAAQRGGGLFLELTEASEPRLADPSLYFDTLHLNAAGARIFSGLLADALAGRLAAPRAARQDAVRAAPVP